MKNSIEFIKGNFQPWEDLGEGVKRQIMGFDKNIMMVKAAFEKNARGKLHKHFHSQTTYVASGKFEVEIDGKKKFYPQEMGFTFPPT